MSSLAFASLTGKFDSGATVTNAPYGCKYTSHRIAIDLETGEQIEVSSDEPRTMPRQVVAEKSSSRDFYVSHESIWSCAFYYMDERGRYQSHILSPELVSDSSDYEFDELVEIYSSCIDYCQCKKGRKKASAVGIGPQAGRSETRRGLVLAS